MTDPVPVVETVDDPLRLCTLCLMRTPLERVPAVAVEHDTECGGRFVCAKCAAGSRFRLEPMEEFWQRVQAGFAVDRLVAAAKPAARYWDAEAEDDDEG